MTVFFYPLLDEDKRGDSENPEETNPKYYRVDITGMQGGVLRGVPNGKYRVICYNFDTEAVLFSDMSDFDKHAGFTREASPLEPIYGNASNRAPRAEGTDNQRVVLCPDMMYGQSVMDVEVHDQGITYICVPFEEKDEYIKKPVTNSEYVITLYPHELTCIYTYEIRNVKNLELALQQTCTLSGMSPQLWFGNEQLHSESVTIPFSAYSDGVSKITGRFITWGHEENNNDPHKLVLYIWMKGEAKGWYYTMDVTNQVHSAPNKRRVHLIVDGLELPRPIITDDGGVDPSVDDWVNVNMDITM